MKKYFLGISIIALLAAGCASEPIYKSPNAALLPQNPATSPNTPPAPVTPVSISGLNPASGPENTPVTITGQGFSKIGNTILFGIASFAGNSSANGKTLQFTVPASLAPHCEPGKACPLFIQQLTPGNYNVSVTNANGSSNVLLFKVTQ